MSSSQEPNPTASTPDSVQGSVPGSVPGEAGKEPPIADIKPLGPIASGRVLQSKMWWITLLCLGVASYLAWQSHRPTGFEITIDFPEGHGLKPGDALEHRDIEVGVITSVAMADDLQGIRATVEVNDSAKGIAVDGSEFWIVRPHVSLTDISGLETAVGSKYIAVSPGPAGSSTKREFVGLTDPPMLGLDEDGVEILLRATESFGVIPGAPISFRGIPVGKVISVELASDAMFIEMRGLIETQYQPLLRSGTKFWQTSGIQVDVGPLTGIKVNTESLAALAIGGVSFITPKTRHPEDLEPMDAGHAYQLLKEPNSRWLENAAPIELTE